MRRISRGATLGLVVALMAVMAPSTPATGATGDAVGTITEYPFPTPGGSSSVAPGPDGNMWFTKGSANQIGRLDPATGTITELDIPTPGSFPHGIASRTSGVWFTEIEGEALGCVEVCGPHPGRARVNGVAVCVPAGG